MEMIINGIKPIQVMQFPFQKFGAQSYKDEPVRLRPNLVEVCDFTVKGANSTN